MSLNRGQLRVERDDETLSVPVEDIAVCVLEHRGVTVSAALLSSLCAAGAAVAVCDGRHMPNGLMLPFHTHSRQSQVAAIQAGWSAPFRKRAWQNIVRAKIANQAHCLTRRGVEQGGNLRKMVRLVESGDAKNREAQAARVYWPALMGKGFIRGAGDLPNAFLNYGYAVVRACVARSLVGAGLLPCFGLHHDNGLNGFNLADDVIEPFRPFVDDMTAGLTAGRDHAEDLGKEDRAALAELPAVQVLIGGELQTILNAAHVAAESLVRATRDKDTSALRLPEFAL